MCVCVFSCCLTKVDLVRTGIESVRTMVCCFHFHPPLFCLLRLFEALSKKHQKLLRREPYSVKDTAETSDDQVLRTGYLYHHIPYTVCTITLCLHLENLTCGYCTDCRCIDGAAGKLIRRCRTGVFSSSDVVARYSSWGVSRGVIICAAPARAGRQAGQPACNGISGLYTNPHKTCGAFRWQAGWPGEAGSRLEAPGIPARRARKSTYKQPSPGQSCIIMVSTLRSYYKIGTFTF